MKNSERGAGLILMILIFTCVISVIYYNYVTEKNIEIEREYNNALNTFDSYSNYYNY